MTNNKTTKDYIKITKLSKEEHEKLMNDPGVIKLIDPNISNEDLKRALKKASNDPVWHTTVDEQVGKLRK